MSNAVLPICDCEYCQKYVLDGTWLTARERLDATKGRELHIDRTYLMALPRLREVREVQGLTQDFLAELAGISVQTVNAIEAGRRRTQRITARALASALGVSVNDLEEIA